MDMALPHLLPPSKHTCFEALQGLLAQFHSGIVSSHYVGDDVLVSAFVTHLLNRWGEPSSCRQQAIICAPASASCIVLGRKWIKQNQGILLSWKKGHFH